jgi:hypothetical protein
VMSEESTTPDLAAHWRELQHCRPMHARLPLAVVLALWTVAVADLSGPERASAATNCPGTFQVLNNDRIGSLRLPAGPYTISISGDVGCAQAAVLFNRFLEDWDGVLPKRWKVTGNGFRQGASEAGFTLTPYRGPPPAPPAPAGGQICQGAFSLTSPDRILSLPFRAGNYSVQLLSNSQSLNCAAAYRYFSNFLHGGPRTPLPRPWMLDARTSTFSRSAGVGFQALFIGGSTGGGGRTTGLICPGTFRVVRSDHINSLSVRAGRYYLYGIGDIGCVEVTNRFRSFLSAGRIPPTNWSLNTQTATFLYQGNRGFRVEPVGGV